MSTGLLERHTYSVADLQIVLGCGRTTVYRILKKQVIPNVQVGRKYLVGKGAVHKFLDSGRQGNER